MLILAYFLIVFIGIITYGLMCYVWNMTKLLVAQDIRVSLQEAELKRLRELFIAYAAAKAKTDEAQTSAIIQLEYRNACSDKAVADHLAKTNPPLVLPAKDKTDKPN